MWWLILGIALIGALIFLGALIERQRIEARTDAEVLAARETIATAHNEVAGMDEAELDALVYGPADDAPAPEHREWHARNDLKPKAEHWD